MKKILIAICLFMLVGCELNNTPTKKVEQFLSNYQILHNDVILDLEQIVNDTNYTQDQKERYKEILKKQYRNMTYLIKEETEDGNNAYVSVEIEVINYGVVLAQTQSYLNANRDEFIENGIYNESKFLTYQLDNLENAKERIKYTITITLTKIDGKWEINDLTDTMEEKINGVYIY